MPNEKSLGNVIYEARTAAGLKLRQAAQQLQIAPSYLSDIENDRRAPSEEVLRRFADLLQLDFDDLMARAGRVGDGAERLIRRQPAAGILFRRLAADNASGDDLEKLLRAYDDAREKKAKT
jgi:transcriptional regulator with XRE-family HTH domain